MLGMRLSLKDQSGDFTAQVGVLGTIHFSHAALAYLFDDLVMGECFANHVSPSMRRDFFVDVTPLGE